MKIAKTFLVACTAVALVAGVSACGEREQVVVYKQGKYQGKPDNKPWQNAQWNNNKDQWETAVKARNLNQNEYTKVE